MALEQQALEQPLFEQEQRGTGAAGCWRGNARGRDGVVAGT